MRQLTSLLLVAVIAALSAALLWQAAGRPGSAGAPEPTLAIDADPANGMRPCSPVDASRTGAPTSGQYTVAICLINSDGAPDAFDALVNWTGGVASAPEIANAAPALDDNPDANQGPGPNSLGTMWDCTGFGLLFPSGGASSARLVCNDTTFGSNSLLTANPGLLGTITLDASGAGTTTFSFDDMSNVNSPAGTNYTCDATACVGATVTQGAGGGGPTATPTNTTTGPTPTPTNTTTGPTATPTNTTTGPTPTPTNTTTGPTPTPTNTTTGPTATRTPTSTLGGPTATRTPTRTPTQPAGTLRGDANGDGLLDSQDALWILWAVANRLPSVPNPSKADWNGDGMLTALDALGILQFHAGYT
jgi:hypothetical protein